MKNKYLIFVCLLLISLFLPLKQALAMPIGTILYRTSGDNKMYGYNANDLLIAEKGKLAHIYSGHAAIYIGKEDGVDYIVEMQPKGAIKVPAKYFVNEALGEKLIGAKIPQNATPTQIAKAVAIAKNLADKNLAYDFDFKYQKGPLSNQWTCVGLTEKVYESAGISNPSNLGSLVYNQNNYAVDITSDGYDNSSVYNKSGDCFSSDSEYSKIERKTDLIIPAPELIGYDVGIEKGGERFIFLPYTQYLQDTLKDVPIDIELSSSFNEPEIRGDSPILGLVLKWSLINNPVSTIKNIAGKVTDVVLAIKDKVFPENSIALADDSTDYGLEAVVSTSTKSATVKASTTKKTTVKVASTTAKTTTSASTGVKVAVIKATSTKGVNLSGGTSKTVSVSLSTPKNTTTAELATTKSTTVKVSTTKATSMTTVSTTTAATTPKTTTVVRTTPKPIIPIATSTKTTATSTSATTTTEIIEEETPVALIAKIYSNGDDDWLEIVNTTDKDFDLASAGYRLEKAKTGADPTLIMRFGNDADGTYPGGTVIGAHGYYLIARSTASADILAQADAIATKDAFSWTEDGYTIYLGTASISSDSDTDIVDKLGYGEAVYYEEEPAEALKKGYALERKVSATSTIESMASGGLEELWPRLYDSNDNSADFILVPYDLSVIESESENPEENNNLEFSALSSDDMTQLWHFDECYGEVSANELQASGQEPIDIKKSDNWAVGHWGCANSISKNFESTKAVWNNPLDPNQMTLNFYYRNTADNFSIVLKFLNSANSGNQGYIELSPYFTNIYGFPGPEKRFEDLFWPNDKQWHQVSLVVNRSGGYWSLYLDGKEVYSYQYNGIMPTFTSFEIASEQTEPVSIDELSFWDRSLPSSELRSINLLNKPFNPYTFPDPQREVRLERYWAFDENGGSIAKESTISENLAVSSDKWDMEGKNDSALIIGNSINKELSSFAVKGLSLSFWWRNSSYPNEGRIRLLLKNSERTIMGTTLTPISPSFIFNGAGYPLTSLPDDNKWHHLALTYDPYEYLLKFYVDGQKKFEREFIKLREGEVINKLEIAQENWPMSIDELKIYYGTLTDVQASSEYTSLE